VGGCRTARAEHPVRVQVKLAELLAPRRVQLLSLHCCSSCAHDRRLPSKMRPQVTELVELDHSVLVLVELAKEIDEPLQVPEHKRTNA
jgi:hypothetical protein